MPATPENISCRDIRKHYYSARILKRVLRFSVCVIINILINIDFVSHFDIPMLAGACRR